MKNRKANPMSTEPTHDPSALVNFFAERGGRNVATSFLRVAAVPAIDGQPNCHDIVLRLDGTYPGEPSGRRTMGGNWPSSDDTVKLLTEQLAAALKAAGIPSPRSPRCWPTTHRRPGDSR